DKTLPHQFASPKDYRAVLRLANTPDVSHAALLQAHAQLVLDRLRAAGGPEVVVMPEDTTELDFSGHNTLALGQLGNGGGRAFLCHTPLAVDPQTREVFGLVDQILHLRRDAPKGELTAAKRANPRRESRLWVDAAANVGPAPAGKRWIRVCDRAADSFEDLEFMVSHGLSFAFRSCQNRALEVEAGDGGPRLLHDRLRALPAQAGGRIELSAQKASKTQPARQARSAWVCAAAQWVRIKAPGVRKGEH